MPPMPPGGIGASGSGSSAINASVVRTKEAIEEAFWTVDLVTFAGSITPAFTKSVISPLAALSWIAALSPV